MTNLHYAAFKVQELRDSPDLRHRGAVLDRRSGLTHRLGDGFAAYGGSP